MSELSAGLGSAGARHFISHEGRAYGFLPFSQKMKDAFQKELFRVYREECPKLPSVADAPDPSAALDAKLAALERQFLSGGFRMESEAGQDHLSRAEGKALLVRLIIERPEGDDDEALGEFLTARSVEVARMIDLVLCESMPGYAKRKARREQPAGNRQPPPDAPTPGAGKKEKKTRK
jgi:hypothetical protein